MTTGELIKEARKRKGITQNKLAELVGTTPQNISQYERGLRNPKIATVAKIADVLDVDVFSIMTFDMASDVIASHINEVDNTSAFDDFLSDLGYRTYINPAWVTTNDKSNLFEWIIEDVTTEREYYVSTLELNDLMNSILSYTKFQISELISKLKEVPKENSDDEK